ncbi:MAG: BNR repeat-like domain-containing protein [Candidatus Methanomarinus sp.]|nr:MAG: BNR repeat-like domain-containing protein [ANME-2 cluster archaeon]
MFVAGCKVEPEPEEEPFNYDIKISPDKKVSDTSSMTLSVTGSEFNQRTIIIFGGKEMETVFENSTLLTCTIPLEDLCLLNTTLKEGTIRDKQIEVTIKSSTGKESYPEVFTLAANYEFPDSTQIAELTDTTSSFKNPRLFFDNQQRMFLYYKIYTPAEGMKGRYKLMIRYSDNQGTSWSNPVTLTSYQAQSNFEIITTFHTVGSNGTIHIFYLKGGNFSNNWTYKVQSKDRGKTWTTAQQVTGDLATFRGVTSNSDGQMMVLGTTKTKISKSGGYVPEWAYITSDNHGKTWLDLRLLRDKIPGNTRQIAGNQISLLVNSDNGRLHLSYWDGYNQGRNYALYSDDWGTISIP